MNTSPAIVIFPSGPKRISVVRLLPRAINSERFLAAFEGSSLEVFPKTIPVYCKQEYFL